ncbi:hypothetical protein J7T55_001604 [Diaporthe amygdali]|uniref:uncharacterized protein n=1 Tax=Phomopsis amygdali TaxID=1214568 RepID=UPI0022FEC148|nr:uncharacterized protein J7T55_001604 [Diaporthe amygdali]KAJ0115194.1 hypothetical protein J7T55_001604 [Diaporthe amygdali]
MAHSRQPGRLAYRFEDDTHPSEASSSGTTNLSPADAIKQAIHALRAFQISKSREYIDEAVELTEHATNSTPSGDDNLAMYLTTLAAMRKHHYTASGDKSSLDGAVQASKRAVEVSRDDDENQNLYIHNLAAALQCRYKESGDNKHLQEGISIMKHIANYVSPEGKTKLLQSLLMLQRLAFEDTSDEVRLDEAISTTELLLENADQDGRIELLYSLGDLYDMRLDLRRTIEHLDDCIRVCRDVLEAIPAEDDRRSAVMHNISVYYTRRYTHDDCLEDLGQAIDFSQKAIGTTDIEQVEKRTSLLEGLAQKFMMWYTREKEFPPLDESILDRHVAGKKTDAKDLPEKATWLFMLSRGLEEKVSHTDPSHDSLDDLEMSMVLVYEALEVTVDNHKNWEDMVNALRKRQRLWSDLTGKIPDTSEIATLLFRKGGRWIAPEHDENISLIKVPYCIKVGDLNATGDEAAKQPVVQCFTAPAKVSKDERQTFIQI